MDRGFIRMRDQNQFALPAVPFDCRNPAGRSPRYAERLVLCSILPGHPAACGATHRSPWPRMARFCRSLREQTACAHDCHGPASSAAGACNDAQPRQRGWRSRASSCCEGRGERHPRWGIARSLRTRPRPASNGCADALEVLVKEQERAVSPSLSRCDRRPPPRPAYQCHGWPRAEGGREVGVRAAMAVLAGEQRAALNELTEFG